MINSQTVYIKSKNKDLSINTFSVVKPDSKKFVEFVTKTKGYFFTPEELKQMLYNVMGHTSNFCSQNEDKNVNETIKRFVKFKDKFIKNFLNK